MTQETPQSTCESCGEREATILFTRIHADEKETLRLCAVCAAREADDPGHQAPGPSDTTEKAERRKKSAATDDTSEPEQPAPQEVTSAGDTSQKVVEVNVVIGNLSKATKGSSNTCPRCGMTYERFRKHGRFGCSDCYTTFANELERLFKRIHGSQRHSGKSPIEPGALQREQALSANRPETPLQPSERAPAAVPGGQDVEELRQQLEQAVTDEDYERAAELRDRIAQLESETESG